MQELPFQVELEWSGSGRDGAGTIVTDYLELELSTPASMGGRGVGTNPEELLVCAVASCYAATLLGVLHRSGLPATSVKIDARGAVSGYPGRALRADRRLTDDRRRRPRTRAPVRAGCPDGARRLLHRPHDRRQRRLPSRLRHRRRGTGGRMITPPATPPRLGPLAAPSEAELLAAYAGLRGQALTLPWAAEALGVEIGSLEALARSGQLLVIPGPWPMRQAHRSGLGYFLPAWQLAAGGRRPHEALPMLLEAAAERGWTSLDLHRFMSAPLPSDGPTPAQLLRQGATTRVVALIRGEPNPRPVALEPSSRRRPFALRAPLRPDTARRHHERHTTPTKGAHSGAAR